MARRICAGEGCGAKIDDRYVYCSERCRNLAQGITPKMTGAPRADNWRCACGCYVNPAQRVKNFCSMKCYKKYGDESDNTAAPDDTNTTGAGGGDCTCSITDRIDGKCTHHNNY